MKKVPFLPLHCSVFHCNFIHGIHLWSFFHIFFHISEEPKKIGETNMNCINCSIVNILIFTSPSGSGTEPVEQIGAPDHRYPTDMDQELLQGDKLIMYLRSLQDSIVSISVHSSIGKSFFLHVQSRSRGCWCGEYRCTESRRCSGGPSKLGCWDRWNECWRYVSFIFCLDE